MSTRPIGLDESTFDRIAGDTLAALEADLSEADESLDVSLSQGVLTVAFEDGGPRYVINSHRAARQIWMAAGAAAWHFDWDGERWISTKSAEELLTLVESIVSKRLGRAVRVSNRYDP